MLAEHHVFKYCASVPWPVLDQNQLDWVEGINRIELWLNQNIGQHYQEWAWDDSRHCYNIGVGFRWDRDRLMFVMVWDHPQQF